MTHQMRYPTDAQLRRIVGWPYTDPAGWLAFARSIWWSADWGWHVYDGIDDFGMPITVHLVSTAGLSGNAEVLDAMESNLSLWGMTWYSHRRGGHYEFRVPRRAQP